MRKVIAKKFHGIDLHKRYSTIIVRDSEGSEIQAIFVENGIALSRE